MTARTINKRRVQSEVSSPRVFGLVRMVRLRCSPRADTEATIRRAIYEGIKAGFRIKNCERTLH
jgi:coenzyme F420-reducing hydrogenase delta subunit